MIKILIVEDNSGDARLIREHLSEAGENFTFQHVLTMKDTLDWLEGNSCDLILLDLSLPDSDGLESVDKILAKRPKVPVVVLTGQKNKEVGLEALRKGAQDFITKGEVELPLLYSKTVDYAIERSKIRNFKDDFLSNVSHELRTPLAIIKETTSQMNDGICGPVNEKQKKYLVRLLNNIERLGTLINDILDISKIEAGRLEIFKEKIDLSAVIVETVNNFAELAQKKGLDLKHFTNGEKIEVLADKGKIVQVLTNFLSNAVKFTEKGTITASVINKEDEVVCSVEDTGKGIAETDLSKVFKKFEQFSREYGPGAKGTGLGLVISKSIVEAHQGRIWVESKLGEGSKFIFSLPQLSFEAFLNSSLERYINSAKKQDQSFGLILFNIKPASLPDDILISIESAVRANLFRKMDMLLRKDQDFYVLLNELKKEDIKTMENRIKDSLQEKFSEEFSKNSVSLISSAAIFPQDGITRQEILQHLKQTD